MAGEGKFALNIEAVYVHTEAGPVPLMDYLAAQGGDAPAPSWVDITGKPSTFPAAAHAHALGDVTGLDAALAGKQDTGSYATTSTVNGIAARVDDLEGADLVPRTDLDALAARVEALETPDPEPEV